MKAKVLTLVFGAVIYLELPLASATEEYNISDVSGMISSPGFPSPYANDLDITWNIKAKPGFRIKVYFTEFDLEDSFDEERGGSCVYDYFEVVERGKVVRKLCGNRRFYPSIMRYTLSRSNFLTLRFVTDFSNDLPLPKGFKAHYKQIDIDECTQMKNKIATTSEDWDHLVYCNHHCHNVPGSYYCSCEPGFQLHENRHTCTSICTDRLLTEFNGTIKTSSYKNRYSKLARCNWVIEAEEGINVIAFRFVGEFGIEEHPEERCVYDWVQYRTVEGFTSPRYCGTHNPNNGSWIKTESHNVTIVFHSDLAVEENGFEIQYQMSKVQCKQQPSNPDNGQMSSNSTKDYFEFGDKVTYSCDIGYRLIGQDNITCSKGGNWSAEEPICEIKQCQHPVHLDNIKNGRIKEKVISMTYNSTVTVLCYQWYRITSGTSVWRCNENETWVEHSKAVALNQNKQVPECEPMCGIKGTRRIRNSNYTFGEAIIPDADTESGIDTQILGGKATEEGEWPWVAFIDLQRGGISTNNFCGGSLISSRAVVTAAHCVERYYADDMMVYLGLHVRKNSAKQESKPKEFTVLEARWYETFDDGHYKDDIAILILGKEVRMSKYIRPICMPNSLQENMLPEISNNDPNNPKAGVVAGWGYTDTSYKQAAEELQEVRLPLIPHKKCVTLFDDRVNKTGPYEQIKITENMMCAGYTDSMGKDSCHGDSGGPYMYQHPVKHVWYLNGVVSFGSRLKCGDDTFGIYTNVSKYMEWISNNMQV